ncbi:MAG: hypothetical protein GY888_32880, partial [Planctomycetaceae bacterium]|nr:hypothetical protein [Planctomycetaceae bacterium]
IDARPADDGRYEYSGYWAYLGSWWGYVDDSVDGLEDPPTGFEPPLGASGPRIVRDNTADDAGVSLDRIKFDTEASEVHAILQFPYGAGTGRNPVNWTDGAVPDVTAAEFHKGRKTNFVGWVLENFGWLKLQQIIWDFYDAGIIVGASGSMTTWEAPANSTMAGETLDASIFYRFVYSVATGNVEVRPQDPPDGPYFDLDFTSMAVASGV